MAEAGSQSDDTRWLRLAAASIWFLTGVLVLHPFYRLVGARYLDLLHLPTWLMYAACAGELVLAAVVMTLTAPRFATALMVVQVGGIVFFTLVLGLLEPMLLVHPFGMLSKNYPLIAVIVTTWLVVREGWSPRAKLVLRAGMALVWVTEGVFPKLLFQQDVELAVVANSGLVPFSPSVFLFGLGVAQALSGLAAMVLRGQWRRALLIAQVASLVLLPTLVSWQMPELWVHPFGPMTKNLPVILGTLVVLRRC